MITIELSGTGLALIPSLLQLSPCTGQAALSVGLTDTHGRQQRRGQGAAPLPAPAQGAAVRGVLQAVSWDRCCGSLGEALWEFGGSASGAWKRCFPVSGLCPIRLDGASAFSAASSVHTQASCSLASHNPHSHPSSILSPAQDIGYTVHCSQLLKTLAMLFTACACPGAQPHNTCPACAACIARPATRRYKLRQHKLPHGVAPHTFSQPTSNAALEGLHVKVSKPRPSDPALTPAPALPYDVQPCVAASRCPLQHLVCRPTSLRHTPAFQSS